MIAAIGRLLQSFVFGILALFKRALCFLNRKRRDSGSILPTHIQNVDSSIPTQVLPASFEIPEQHSNPIQDDQFAPTNMTVEDESFAAWDSWDANNPAQVMSNSQSASSASHQSSRQMNAEPVEPEPEPDYFSDLGLAPTIKKQKKVLIKPSSQSDPVMVNASQRLSFNPDAVAPVSAELGEWEDDIGAWEDEDIQIEEDAFKQSRKAERERRLAGHQRRNQEKEMRKLQKETSLIGTRLSKN